jgi:hypothetical protein
LGWAVQQAHAPVLLQHNDWVVADVNASRLIVVDGLSMVLMRRDLYRLAGRRLTLTEADQWIDIAMLSASLQRRLLHRLLDGSEMTVQDMYELLAIEWRTDVLPMVNMVFKPQEDTIERFPGGELVFTVETTFDFPQQVAHALAAPHQFDACR